MHVKKTFLAMLLFVIALLMISVASAADHLLPIGPGEGILDEKADAAWIKVIDQDDMAFVRFDVEPALTARNHLAVFGKAQIGKKGPFRLCYLKGSYREEETPICVPIGDDFANSLASKVETIIRRDTYYGVPNDDMGPIDDTRYFFAANFTFAEVTYPTKGSIPDQLIKALKKCTGLTQMKPDDVKRQALMDEVLKDLDAIKLPQK